MSPGTFRRGGPFPLQSLTNSLAACRCLVSVAIWCVCVSVLTLSIANFSGSENHTAHKIMKLLFLRLIITTPKQLTDTGPERDTGSMLKPMHPSHPTYVRLIARLYLRVKKEYPLLEGLLWRVGCGTLYFFKKKGEPKLSPSTTGRDRESVGSIRPGLLSVPQRGGSESGLSRLCHWFFACAPSLWQIWEPHTLSTGSRSSELPSLFALLWDFESCRRFSGGVGSTPAGSISYEKRHFSVGWNTF